MKSDHHSLTGAGNPHSICDLCGQAEEAELIRPYATTVFAAHLCPSCLAAAEREYREIYQEETRKARNLSWAAMVYVVVWAVVAGAVAWRWWC